MLKKFKYYVRKILMTSVFLWFAMMWEMSLPGFLTANQEQAIVMGKNQETKEVWITLGGADGLRVGQLCYVMREAKEIGVLKVSRVFNTFSIAEAIDIMSFDNIHDRDIVIDRKPSENETLMMETLVKEISGMKAGAREESPPARKAEEKSAPSGKGREEKAAELQKVVDELREKNLKYQKRIKILEEKLRLRDEKKLHLIEELKRIKKEYLPADKKQD